MSFLQGELATFQKLSAIQANCAIEMALDACMGKLTEQISRDRRTRQPMLRSMSSARHTLARSRIPSWLHLPALGEPPLGVFVLSSRRPVVFRWFLLF
jgi:TAG lipase / steryl ester hydrolase / phospholipase A2 / LPA acyltransferase